MWLHFIINIVLTVNNFIHCILTVFNPVLPLSSSQALPHLPPPNNSMSFLFIPWHSDLSLCFPFASRHGPATGARLTYQEHRLSTADSLSPRQPLVVGSPSHASREWRKCAPQHQALTFLKCYLVPHNLPWNLSLSGTTIPSPDSLTRLVHPVHHSALQSFFHQSHAMALDPILPFTIGTWVYHAVDLNGFTKMPSLSLTGF